MAKKKKKWIQAAFKKIRAKGTKGKCSGKRYGKGACSPGTKAYAMAKTLKKLRKRKKK